MKFTIITVCLNSENTIKYTLNSILEQSHKDLEHIIIDGGSTDNTTHILKNYPFKNKKVILKKKAGIYESINIGIKKAKGDVIAILHSNDIFQSPETISNINNYFSKTNENILLTNIVFFKDDQFKQITRYYTAKNFQPWMLRFGLMPPHTGAFIKKKIYNENGLYDEKFKIAGDFDLFLRFFFN